MALYNHLIITKVNVTKVVVIIAADRLEKKKKVSLKKNIKLNKKVNKATNKVMLSKYRRRSKVILYDFSLYEVFCQNFNFSLT